MGLEGKGPSLQWVKMVNWNHGAVTGHWREQVYWAWEESGGVEPRSWKSRALIATTVLVLVLPPLQYL